MLNQNQSPSPLTFVRNLFNIRHLFKVIYFIGLVILIQAAYLTAFVIQYLGGLLTQPNINLSAYFTLIPLISIASIILADYFQLARFFRKKNLDVISQSISLAFILSLITIAAAYYKYLFSFPRMTLTISAFFIFLYTALWTGFCLTISRKLYGQGELIIIGSNTDEMNLIAKQIKSSLVELDLILSDHFNYDESDQIKKRIKQYSEILICPSVPDYFKSELILYCAKKNTVAYLVPEFYEITLYKSKLIHFNDLMVFMVDRLKLTFEQRILKRLFDILVSLFALFVLGIPLLIAIIAIKLTSKGSFLYKQERVTLDKKKFQIYKLRTMEVDAETSTGPVISGKADPRVTRPGRFLRRSKLDEVPQFINVLKGDMSVVGPRSERPIFVDQFSQQFPAYNQRFSVKSGITGLAQVAGSYDTTPEDKLRYDLLYIKNYSVLQDIKIIFQTVRAIFTPNLYNKTFQENKNSYGAAPSVAQAPPPDEESASPL